jgi:hypothetical protein
MDDFETVEIGLTEIGSQSTETHCVPHDPINGYSIARYLARTRKDK